MNRRGERGESLPNASLDESANAPPVRDFQHAAASIDTSRDAIVINHANDVARVLSDRSLSVDPLKGRYPARIASHIQEERYSFSIIALDEPAHGELRGLISKAFTPRAVEAMRPAIENICMELLEEIDPDQPFDLVARYAAKVPLLSIAAMLGVDAVDVPTLKRLSEDRRATSVFDRSDEEWERRRRSRLALDGWFSGIIEERRRNPGDDLVSALIQAQADGARLSDQEVINTCRLLLIAGNTTTSDLIGNAVATLLAHPRQLDRLRADASHWPDAVEEVLRFDPPVTSWNRRATTSMEIGGCPIAPGQTITASLAMANRDPSLHHLPDVFDITRHPQKHHSFGGGVHFCLGASLARLEAQISLQLLFDRFPALRIVDHHPPVQRAAPPFSGYAQLLLDPNARTCMTERPSKTPNDRPRDGD